MRSTAESNMGLGKTPPRGTPAYRRFMAELMAARRRDPLTAAARRFASLPLVHVAIEGSEGYAADVARNWPRRDYAVRTYGTHVDAGGLRVAVWIVVVRRRLHYLEGAVDAAMPEVRSMVARDLARLARDVRAKNRRRV